ncbi:hypothetical protein F4859DRAFT_488907 [Xylaria cf. heliscus]|nr:hypothetical protein F4859DRAFT_488907 [Xylaria cf. heliscus]
MVTRTSHASALALWLLINSFMSQTTTAAPSTSLISTSTFSSSSLSRNNKRGLSEDDKIGVSVAVTFAAIILVGSIAIFCIIRRRHEALAKPQTRALDSDEIDDESTAVGGDTGKGKQVYYMTPSQASNPVLLQQAPDGTIYQAGEYPTVPEQTYAPQQQAHAVHYPATHSGETYAYSGTAYPAAAVIDPTQQNGYAGPSNAQYQSTAYLQQSQQQQQHQQEGHMSWNYSVSTTSPEEAIPAQDFQYKYLQDYQEQPQNPHTDQSQYQNGDPASGQGYQENTYYVPPPRPHASELPDQRKPVELVGEGHYKEAP